MSVSRLGHDVMVRPRRASASTSHPGPWQLRAELWTDLHLLVHPRPTGIPDVSLETGPRCYGPPAEGIGFDQQPGAMANRRDRLVPVHELADELHRILVRAQLVGIGNSAGKHESVEITGRDLGHLDVHTKPLSLRVVVHRLDLAWFVRYQHD